MRWGYVAKRARFFCLVLAVLGAWPGAGGAILAWGAVAPGESAGPTQGLGGTSPAWGAQASASASQPGNQAGGQGEGGTLDAPGMESYDFHEIQDFIDKQKGVSGWHLSFQDLMGDLMAGRFQQVLSKVGKAVEDSLFSEVSGNGKLMAQVILLGLVGAVFTNFSSVFSNSQISETGFFVTYLLLFTCLAASFLTSISIAGEVVGQILEFMRALAPAYFLAAAFAGGSVSSLASYEFTLLMINLAQWLLSVVVLPMVKVYMILVLAGHIAKEDTLSKMTGLLSNVIQWSLKTMLAVILGVHLVQGMVLPYVDSMKGGVVRKFISAIPGIGQGVNSITQVLLGSGVMIKNTMGAAGVVILVVMAAIPVVKLVVLMFLYQLAAALVQPVCDKRVVSCISDTAHGHKLLLGIVMAAILMFVITIAMVCASSNVSYYSG